MANRAVSVEVIRAATDVEILGSEIVANEIATIEIPIHDAATTAMTGSGPQRGTIIEMIIETNEGAKTIADRLAEEVDVAVTNEAPDKRATTRKVKEMSRTKVISLEQSEKAHGASTATTAAKHQEAHHLVGARVTTQIRQMVGPILRRVKNPSRILRSKILELTFLKLGTNGGPLGPHLQHHKIFACCFH